MKDNPGTLQGGGAPFHTTHWSVVVQALESQPPASAQQALGEFCQAYWAPLYTFVRRRGHPPADAQDLVQGFFGHLLSHDTLSRADRAKGKLRTFLLGSLQHYLANEYDRAQALKRGGGQQLVSMDDQLVAAEAALVAGHGLDETAGYDQAWVATLVGRSWQRLQEAFAAEGRAEVLGALEPFLLGGAAAPSQQEAAARLQMPFASFRSTLRRTRQRYRETLRDEVARTLTHPSQVDEELRHLYQLLMVQNSTKCKGRGLLTNFPCSRPRDAKVPVALLLFVGAGDYFDDIAKGIMAIARKVDRSRIRCLYFLVDAPSAGVYDALHQTLHVGVRHAEMENSATRILEIFGRAVGTWFYKLEKLQANTITAGQVTNLKPFQLGTKEDSENLTVKRFADDNFGGCYQHLETEHGAIPLTGCFDVFDRQSDVIDGARVSTIHRTRCD